jgi:hypothetical protein
MGGQAPRSNSTGAVILPSAKGFGSFRMYAIKPRR